MLEVREGVVLSSEMGLATRWAGKAVTPKTIATNVRVRRTVFTFRWLDPAEISL